jgi:hypothetical protein
MIFPYQQECAYLFYIRMVLYALRGSNKEFKLVKEREGLECLFHPRVPEQMAGSPTPLKMH